MLWWIWLKYVSKLKLVRVNIQGQEHECLTAPNPCRIGSIMLQYNAIHLRAALWLMWKMLARVNLAILIYKMTDTYLQRCKKCVLILVQIDIHGEKFVTPFNWERFEVNNIPFVKGFWRYEFSFISWFYKIGIGFSFLFLFNQGKFYHHLYYHDILWYN